MSKGCGTVGGRSVEDGGSLPIKCSDRAKIRRCVSKIDSYPICVASIRGRIAREGMAEIESLTGRKPSRRRRRK